MTNLSLAATAVLDAYMNNCGWLDGPFEKDYRCAAAVLRAAVHQLNKKRWEPGVHWARMELLAIADELEVQ